MEKVISQIQKRIKNDKIIVACSTGIDSTVLLDLCLKALPNNNITIAHVNHNMREESKEEEAYIISFARRHNIDIRVASFTFSNQNFEEEARIKRYTFFKQVALEKGAKYILLAHHGLDNAETIIMRILKSSSLKGYAGIEELTKLKADGDIYLYRPLLSVDKDDIIKYAKDNNLTYFDDVTNTSDDHLRNRIRKYIIPCLKEENPNLINAINYYSESLLGASRLLEDSIECFIKENVAFSDDTITIKKSALQKQTAYLQKEIIFSLLKKYQLSINNINEIFKIINSDKNTIITSINKHLNLIKEYDTIIFTTLDISRKNFYLEIKNDGKYDITPTLSVIVDKNNCTFLECDKKLCYNIKCMPLIIRSRKNGDTIKRINNKSFNMPKVYYQKLSDILTNQKIPYLKRNNLLVVVSNNEIITVLGLKLKQ